jgi:hypothetical protein
VTEPGLPGPAAAAVVGGLVSFLVAVVTASITALTLERKLRRDYQLEFAAEAVARKLLNDPRWTLRTFKIIDHHLAGFSNDDLRQLLVRAGAIRFKSKSGIELWGMLERNLELLGVEYVNDDPETIMVDLPHDGGSPPWRVERLQSPR